MEEMRSQRKQMVSPERSPVWSEPPPPLKHHHNYRQHKLLAAAAVPAAIVGKKVPVVYYLCRNRHLEHPHFIEVPVSSPDGLYLRDVISRLDAVRGKGMAAMYSWSCKRSYKNGFVWHDLSHDDLILPANGNEYVLKGSELLERSHQSSSNGGNVARLQSNLKLGGSFRTAQEAIAIKETKYALSNAATCPLADEDDERELSPPPREAGSSGEDGSPEIRTYPSPPLSSTEYRLCKPLGASDASTQTDDGRRRLVTCTRGMSTEDGSEIGTPPQPLAIASSSESSSSNGGDRTETLESLIRSNVRKGNPCKVLREDETEQVITSGSKLKPANMLIQLITCGSIAVKDHRGVGLVSCSYSRPRLSPAKFASPAMLADLACLAESPRFVGLRSEDKEYFSGSLIETKKQRGGDFPVLRRSNSYNEDRSCKSPDSKMDKEQVAESSSRSKCLPRAIKISTNKQPKHEATRSPLSEVPRHSSSMQDCGISASLPSSRHGSKRFNDASSAKCSSMRLESFVEDKEKVIKIEERLTSGARVIIQSRALSDSDGSSNSEH